MSSNPLALIEASAAFAATASAAEHRELIGLHLADSVIALLAGGRSAEGRAIFRFLTRIESAAPADPSRMAALMRLSEVDDIHRASAVTASAIVLPAALAIRTRLPHASPQQFTDALFVGRELSVRLALSMGGAALLTQGLWPTYLVAPFGAAATAARLLSLSADRTAHALALALAQTPRAVGRIAGDRPGRWILFGNAVRAGCFAALAAADGFDGDLALLNAGWLRSVGGDAAHADPLVDSLAGLADGVCLLEQTSIKPHCSAKQGLAAIYGLQQLMAQGLDPATIESIEVAVPSAYAGMLDREPPGMNRVAGIVSVRGQLALAALQPTWLDDVSRDALPWHDEALHAFAARVSVRTDVSLERCYPEKWPARLTVKTRDGSARQVEIEDSPGDPALRFDAAAIMDKARRMLPADLGFDPVAIAMNATTDPLALDALCWHLDPAI